MARSTTIRKKSATGPAPAPILATAPARSGRVFAVTRSRGAAWDPALPLAEQAGWAEHAAFMNGLESSGFVVLGGPLEGTPYTMLAVRAENEAEVKRVLAADPWETSRTLETTRIATWTLALGADKI